MILFVKKDIKMPALPIDSMHKTRPKKRKKLTKTKVAMSRYGRVHIPHTCDLWNPYRSCKSYSICSKYFVLKLRL